MSLWVKVGARSSLLSRAQVQEVWQALSQIHENVQFEPVWIDTRGDQDLLTSLKTMEKSDFFTYEIDQALMRGECDVAIHAAKDLPDVISPELKIVAITRGVDSADVLVWREGEGLPGNPRIGTSSIRREAQILSLYPQAECIDIRGSIESRLRQLQENRYDAVVMAKAALIRLGWLHYPHLELPIEVAPLQGRLAVMARESDQTMIDLFECIHDKEIALSRH